jgi:hypothetical protein
MMMWKKLYSKFTITGLKIGRQFFVIESGLCSLLLAMFFATPSQKLGLFVYTARTQTEAETANSLLFLSTITTTTKNHEHAQ